MIPAIITNHLRRKNITIKERIYVPYKGAVCGSRPTVISINEKFRNSPIVILHEYYHTQQFRRKIINQDNIAITESRAAEFMFRVCKRLRINVESEKQDIKTFWLNCSYYYKQAAIILFDKGYLN